MFKGIYFKLVATYLSLFIVIVLLISFFISSIFYKEFTNQVEEDLLNAGIKTNALMERYYNNDITKEELTAWINAMAYISNLKIYILNPDSSVLHQAEQSEAMSIDTQLRQDILKVMEGETVKRTTSFSLDENRLVYVGIPLTYHDQISGAIMAFSPITEIQELTSALIKVIVVILILVILIGTIAILRVSVKISEPISEISDYAKRIGKGENVPDVEFESKDEIGMLAKSFNEMKRELAVSEQMRRDIVANVSHELRTPLTSIIGFIKGILDGVIPVEDHEKYLSIAYDEANRLKELTKDIVDVAKIESGSVALNKENINLNELTREVYTEMEELVKEKNLDFIFEELSKNIEINADKSRIRQVLINIINNSMKFTEKGFIKITLDKIENKASIVVEDSGVGIKEDKIAYLFNKFYTANNYGDATMGAGLGLNIVKNLIDLHGGEIKIESQVNKGTTVKILL
ncbi:MAG: HAMP domain-containing histidine kinase [Clostridia bacterium]|nr:HAMP domain-containing histidine kinase [Clostridia bacterium]